MEETLQHQATPQCFGLPAACATGHRFDGPKANLALTFNLDHADGDARARLEHMQLPYGWPTGHGANEMTNKQLDELLNAFIRRRPHLEASLGADQGIRLMNLEAQIAERLIYAYTAARVPVLVHGLFGDWGLVREWGRNGRSDQMRTNWYESEVQVKDARFDLHMKKAKRGYV